MGLSVIIPSKTVLNLRRCVEAIRASRESCRVIVIDDFEIRPGELASRRRGFLAGLEPVEWIDGVKPFIYARNMNLGIATAGRDDVLLLNDDALLETPGGFTSLELVARMNPDFGVLSATTNFAGNPNQLPGGEMLREDPRMVCFVAVLVLRRTIDAVGLLDERFSAYGWDDNDYCRRVREAGLKIGISERCFCDHLSLKSTFRNSGWIDVTSNKALYAQKWGDLQ